MPRLQILNGKRQGAVFDVAQGTEHIVGHRQSASITIDDPWVSWDHARLFFDEDDHSYWIEDLGSTNGTYVNCVRVKREPLRHEDIVFLGKTHVIFLSPAEEHQAAVSPIFGSSSEAESVPLSSASQAGADVLAPGSSADPLAATNAKLPARDPFQSAPSQASQPFPSARAKAPFSDSGVDPFSAGPDYAAAMRNPPPMAPPAPSGSFRGLLSPDREARSLSETNSDENAMMAPSEGTGLHLSRLGDEDLDVSGPSADEISRLITGTRDRDETPRDIPLAAQPRPAPPRREPPRREPPRRPPPGAALRPRPTPPHTLSGRIKRVEPPPARPELSELATARSVEAPSTARVPEPPPPARRPAGPPDPDPSLSMPTDLSKLAFERARLEDMVRRLRAALDATSKVNPQAVQAATQGLRDQELARQARRIAELEETTTQLRQGLDAKQDELDQVTEDMIEKEDTIDGLRAEIARLGSRVAVPPRPQQGPPGGASSYDSLQF